MPNAVWRNLLAGRSDPYGRSPTERAAQRAQEAELRRQFEQSIPGMGYASASVAGNLLPGAGIADFLGEYPSPGGGNFPGFTENLTSGQFADASLQLLDAGGEVASALGPLGVAIGTLAGVPRGAQRAKNTLQEASDGIRNVSQGSSPSSGAIRRNSFENTAQAAAQERAATQVEALTPRQRYEEYRRLASTDDGRLIDADAAREMFSDFRENPSLHAASVHTSASEMARNAYVQRLKEPVTSNPEALFTAGGAGSGKTGVARAADPQGYERAHVIFDGTFKNPEKAVADIERARDAGMQRMVVDYTFTDPVDSLRRAALRAQNEGGRTVPLSVMAESHEGSNRTIRELSTRYANDEAVELRIINNNGDFGEAFYDSLDNIDDQLYIGTEKRMREELNRMLQNGEITRQIYEGFL